jgi:alkylation response protein AidB-like acyl-CoA dehydrogenase
VGALQERYGFDDAAEMWRCRAARFAADELAPRAREADRSGRMDPAVLPALGAAGLIGATLPAEVGGGGASAMAGALIAEEIGAVDGSVRGFLAVQVGLVASSLVRHGSAAQVRRWLPGLVAGTTVGAFGLTEPEAGSDVGSLRARLRRDGNQLVLDGEKVWITNGGIADVLIVFASEDPPARTRGLSAVLVTPDQPGVRRLPLEGHALGHRASDHARLVFEGVRLTETDRLGAPGEGFAVAMGGLGVGRLHVAAGAVGIQRACLEACVQFARTRRQFGQRIGDFQQIGAELAAMATRLETSRLLVHQAARLADEGLDDKQAVAMAKLHATECAVETTTRAIQLHGSRGYSDEVVVERHHRDAIALTIYEGTSHVQRVILARELLGKDVPPDEGKPA